MTRMRTLAAVLLVLLLAAAGVPMAVARASAPAAGTAVLCAAGGEGAVAVDASGRPLPLAGHICPDCLPHVPALAPQGAPLLARAFARGRRSRPPRARTAPARLHRRPPARAPPVAD